MTHFVTVIAEVILCTPHTLGLHTAPVIASFVIDIDVKNPIEPQLNQKVKELAKAENMIKQIIAFSPINEFYISIIESLTDKVTYLSLDAVQLPK